MQEIVYHTNYKLENDYWWFVARNRIIANLIEKKTDLSRGDQILDFGCGTGGFASIINEEYDVVGLDLSELALNYAKKRGISKLYQDDIRKFPKDDYEIKAITALDVIEHIEDDLETCKVLYDLLPKGGYLIASVPAYKFLWSYHDEMHMHYRRYTKSNFTKLLQNAGFSINYSSYFNSLLFPLALTRRLTEKKQVDKSKIDNYQPVDKLPNSINSLFKNIFLAEDSLIGNISFPFGLSIVVVSQKK